MCCICPSPESLPERLHCVNFDLCVICFHLGANNVVVFGVTENLGVISSESIYTMMLDKCWWNILELISYLWLPPKSAGGQHKFYTLNQLGSEGLCGVCVVC